ncbi:hypothetical protein BH11MYX1_BH11MYX1_47610 [soil metagenome]
MRHSGGACNNPKMRVGMQRWVAVGVAVSIAGCSFGLGHGRQPPPALATDCTTSRLVPILDSAFTTVMVLSVVQALTTSDADWQKQLCDATDPMCTPALSQGGAALIFTPLALLGAAGMYYGFTRTTECRDARPRATEEPQPMPVAAPPPVVVAPPNPAPVVPTTTPSPVAPVPPSEPAHEPTEPPTTAVPANPYDHATPAAPVTKPPPAKPLPKPKPKADAPPAPPVGIPLPGGA